MEPVGDYIAQWGEGPIWHEDTFYYVDIEGHAVVAYEPGSGTERTWPVGQRVGTVVPRASGGLVIAGDHGFAALDMASGELAPLVDPEADLPGNRFNDGKCDPEGRFYAGTMDLSRPRQPTGAFYRLDADLSVEKLFAGVTVSNGIAWNAAADTMYYIDSPRRKIEAFDYDRASGALGGRRAVIDTEGLEGVPDGMAIDDADRLWVAMCHGGVVHCFDPAAPNPDEPVQTLALPVIEPTAVAFGGEDLADLYITTGLSGERRELDGRLFVTRPGARGVPATPFAG